MNLSTNARQATFTTLNRSAYLLPVVSEVERSVVSSNFRVVIPKGIREKAGLKPGQRIVFEPMGRDLRLFVLPDFYSLQGKFPELRNGPSRKELWQDKNR